MCACMRMRVDIKILDRILTAFRQSHIRVCLYIGKRKFILEFRIKQTWNRKGVQRFFITKNRFPYGLCIKNLEHPSNNIY